MNVWALMLTFMLIIMYLGLMWLTCASMIWFWRSRWRIALHEVISQIIGLILISGVIWQLYRFKSPLLATANTVKECAFFGVVMLIIWFEIASLWQNKRRRAGFNHARNYLLLRIPDQQNQHDYVSSKDIINIVVQLVFGFAVVMGIYYFALTR